MLREVPLSAISALNNPVESDIIYLFLPLYSRSTHTLKSENTRLCNQWTIQPLYTGPIGWQRQPIASHTGGHIFKSWILQRHCGASLSEEFFNSICCRHLLASGLAKYLHLCCTNFQNLNLTLENINIKKRNCHILWHLYLLVSNSIQSQVFFLNKRYNFWKVGDFLIKLELIFKIFHNYPNLKTGFVKIKTLQRIFPLKINIELCNDHKNTFSICISL